MDETNLKVILQFLARIGIATIEASLPADTFLPGIVVRDGALWFDRAKLLWPGDLLHEAGHLAVLPAHVRVAASDDLAPESELAYAGEMEAMAWTYAAAVELDLPLDVVFHSGGYRGQSNSLCFTYAHGVYPGLPGLCATGMARAPKQSDPDDSVPAYPKMLRWLRPDG